MALKSLQRANQIRISQSNKLYTTQITILYIYLNTHTNELSSIVGKHSVLASICIRRIGIFADKSGIFKPHQAGHIAQLAVKILR